MISVIQRVTNACVSVDNSIIGQIDTGIVALIGIEKHDSAKEAERLLQRILGYRIFSDNNGKMNLSLQDIHGGLLLIPQFTLVANTKKGMRPSFASAANPHIGEELFKQLCELAKSKHEKVALGSFGADMQVLLCNNGPVTFFLSS